MPCRDYYDDHPEQAFRDLIEPEYKKKIAFLESALCGAMNALEKHNLETYKVIDFKEAGITPKELKTWYKEHQKQDSIRKAEEAKKKIKENALAKLTAEEKEILGL